MGDVFPKSVWGAHVVFLGVVPHCLLSIAKAFHIMTLNYFLGQEAAGCSAQGLSHDNPYWLIVSSWWRQCEQCIYRRGIVLQQKTRHF